MNTAVQVRSYQFSVRAIITSFIFHVIYLSIYIFHHPTHMQFNSVRFYWLDKLYKPCQSARKGPLWYVAEASMAHQG